MSIVRWNRDYYPSVSRMFNDFFNTELVDWSKNNFSSTNTNLPAVNVKEMEDAFVVEMAAPGLKKEDFNIEVKDNQLILSSEHEMKNEERNGDHYTKREFSYQSFKRTFNLPDTVNAEDISAKYHDGILDVHIPKKPEAQPRPPKKIEIG